MKKLTFLLLFLLTSVVSFAYDFEVNGIYYNKLSDNTCEVTSEVPDNYYSSYTPSYSGIVVIGKEVTYGGKSYSVIRIGDRAFKDCSGLTSVTIPNSVTSIGEYAFYLCSGLTSVTIPNSVLSIGSSAFYKCKNLKSVHISSIESWCNIKFESSNANPLYNDGQLILNDEPILTLVIPNYVTSIGNYAFRSCSGLISVTIPNSVTSIGRSAFEGCSGLTSVTIPNSVTSIGDYAFSDCSSLTSVTIPSSVTSIDDYAFSDCSSLTSVTIPNSVTSIGSSAFYGCSGLTSVAIPNSVTSIGSRAFFSCSDLTSITIPNSVTSIGYDAFRGCSGLTSLTIPNSVTSIGYGAFYGCSGLTLVTIPNSVTSIGSNAFYGCSGLTSVSIPNSVTSIGDSAFEGCSGLTFVTIPNSVTRIGDSAFRYCSGLTSVTIPNSVTSIGYGVFGWCSRLSNVTVLHATPLKLVSNDIFSSTPSKKTLHVHYGLKEVYAKAYVWGSFSQILDDVPRPDKPTRVVFDKDEYYIKLDESGYFKPHTEPSEYESLFGVKYKYSVDNSDVLMIDPNSGQYYGYSDGVATVTVRVENMNLEASVKVYVGTAKPDPKPDPEKCATPTISLVDGEVIATCETEGAVCHITTRMNANTPSGDDSVMPTAILTVTAYATAEGYEKSETATKEFDLMKLQGEGGVRGDTNGDGQVTVTDIVKTAGYILTGEWGE